MQTTLLTFFSMFSSWFPSGREFLASQQEASLRWAWCQRPTSGPGPGGGRLFGDIWISKIHKYGFNMVLMTVFMIFSILLTWFFQFLGGYRGSDCGTFWNISYSNSCFGNNRCAVGLCWSTKKGLSAATKGRLLGYANYFPRLLLYQIFGKWIDIKYWIFGTCMSSGSPSK